MMCTNNKVLWRTDINEPRYEKTGLRGFRPDPTQTGPELSLTPNMEFFTPTF